MFEQGQIVFSKCGRDKGLAFVVVDTQGEYAYLVDGSLRLWAKPKKKKARHIQVTKSVSLDLQKKLENKEHILDADFRKALSPYQKPVNVIKEVQNLVER